MDVRRAQLVEYVSISARRQPPRQVQRKPISLLQAALHNFPLDQPFERPSFIQPALAPLDTPDPTRAAALRPQDFATLCRELDLGQAYQAHLDRYFTDATGRLWIDATRARLRVDMQVARGASRISASQQEQLLLLVDGITPRLQVRQPTLFGIPLHDMLLLDHPDQTITAWLPGDNRLPLTAHANLQDLAGQLKQRLCLADFRRYFLGFVPRDQQAHVLSLLRYHLSLLDADADSDWVLPLDAELHLGEQPIEGDVFAWLWQQHGQRVRDEARQLAVPTAEADARHLQAIRSLWANGALAFLNAAAFFIPGLGAVMMGVTALQLAGEVFEGIESWQQGDVDTAFAHLESVALNAALIGGFAVAGTVTPRLFNSPLMEGLVKVRRADSRERLWKPDPAPYRSTQPLPPGLSTNALGQYVTGDRYFIKLDGAVHEQRFDPQLQQWRLVHPYTPNAYEPVLEHNGQGSWRLEHEQPLTWTTTRLLRRIGPLCEGLADAELEQARLISGTSADQLRRMQVDNSAPPPLLADTLERLQALRTLKAQGRSIADFEAVYDPPGDSDARVVELQARYPRLSRPLARRLLHDQQAQQVNDALPLVRAFEGLYLPALLNQDSERLIFKAVEQLQDWPAQLRIELRAGSAEGPLLARIGSLKALQQQVLVKSAEGYRHAGQAQAGGLYQALFDALPQARRLALGDARALEQQVQTLATAQRHQVARWLWSHQAFEWPAQGRLRGGVDPLHGYPPQNVSQHPLAARYRRLFPMHSDEQMLFDFNDWRQHWLDAATRLRELEDQYQSLRTSLEQWHGGHPPRQKAARAIQDSWQHTSLRNVENNQVIHALDLTSLELSDADLAELQLPPGFEHVQELELTGNPGITRLPQHWLPRLPALRRLTLIACRFDQVPEVPAPERLLALDLERNRITWNAQQQTRLDGYLNLEILDLSDNPLIEAPNLAALRRLQSLDLSGCCLTQLPEALREIEAPYWLNLSNNQFTHLPDDLQLSAEAAKVLDLESDALAPRVYEQVDAYYDQYQIDLLVPDFDYEELLLETTAEHWQIWQRLPLQYRRDLRDLLQAEPFLHRPDFGREQLWHQLERLDSDMLFRAVALTRPARELLTLQITVIG
nr:DUF6543 domain-containing protein [Pseudomonas sp. BGr12]MDL2422215.1 hypothetical protein [Pseudomonas sp. BGr12]